jgi:hypothetical protein
MNKTIIFALAMLAACGDVVKYASADDVAECKTGLQFDYCEKGGIIPADGTMVVKSNYGTKANPLSFERTHVYKKGFLVKSAEAYGGNPNLSMENRFPYRKGIQFNKSEILFIDGHEKIVDYMDDQMVYAACESACASGPQKTKCAEGEWHSDDLKDLTSAPKCVYEK